MSDSNLTERQNIKVLPDRVVNQIAAGEIVERPASVVRELVDNSIDAGATQITVSLIDGGRTRIEISDNGIGMSKDDALLSLERHATSKIRESNDLAHISSLGFRGEALPSIAAVSKCCIQTKRKDDPIGTEIYIEAGKVRAVESVSCTSGTMVRIDKLFYCLPARRKFLRTAQTEFAKIKEWLVKAALPYPHVRYTLLHGGRQNLVLPRVDTFAERARRYVGGSLATQIDSRSFVESNEIDYEDGGIRVTGVVGHPGSAVTDSKSFVLIVNGRVVRDTLVLRAVREGYDTTLKPREYPAAVLRLEIDPSEVDVNVHPQKSEVQFRRPNVIFALVRDAVQSSIHKFTSPVSATVISHSQSHLSAKLDSSKLQEQINYVAANSSQSLAGVSSNETIGLSGDKIRVEMPTLRSVEQDSRTNSPTNIHSPKLQAPKLQVVLPQDAPAYDISNQDASNRVSTDIVYSELRYIGQLLDCYLLCEHKNRFVLVDMHAAHERINYNSIRAQFKQGTLSSQLLLVPESVALSHVAASQIELHLDQLARFGFEVEPFGENTVLIRAVPTVLDASCLKISDIIKEIAEVSFQGIASGQIEEALDKVAARLACHASIRSGRKLNRQEAYALFEQMDTTQFAAACPHGRPVVVFYTENEVEGWFGRDK